MLRSRVLQYTDDFTPTWSDFGGYLDAVQRAGSTLNLAVQVGHGTVWACVLGMDASAPSGAELERMQALVAESLDAGFAADLVVFDPDIVVDTATFEAPHRYPTGIPHVAVNGVLVVENGAFTGQTPGKVIRSFGD